MANETDTDVVVFLEYPDGETSIMEIGPGEHDASNFSGRDGCAPATLIARDRSGVEVDRMEQPFCIGDRWEIQNELP